MDRRNVIDDRLIYRIVKFDPGAITVDPPDHSAQPFDTFRPYYDTGTHPEKKAGSGDTAPGRRNVGYATTIAQTALRAALRGQDH